MNQNHIELSREEWICSMRVRRRDLELIARLKEPQYEKAVKLMNEYCDQYQIHEEIVEERKTIQMDVSRFPSSAARMIVLGVLQRIPQHPIRFEELSLFFEVGKNAKDVKTLLERDLYPAIPFVEAKKTLQISGLGVYPWFTREPLD